MKDLRSFSQHINVFSVCDVGLKIKISGDNVIVSFTLSSTQTVRLFMSPVCQQVIYSDDFVGTSLDYSCILSFLLIFSQTV